jgi:hypothetical protein
MEANIGMNQFCGPAVLSIFTGCNTDDCADEISKVNGKAKITGVMPADLIAAGNAMGLEFHEIPSFAGRSIFWAASVLTRMPAAKYLVTIPKHYITLEVRDNSIYLCDNHTKTEIDLQNSSRLAQRIERVWRVEKIREFSKPHPVSSQFHAEQLGSDIYLKRVVTLSDGGIKVFPIGSFQFREQSDIQEIAFELMKLTGKE